MLRNERAYLLLEAMTAILVLSLAVIVFFPVMEKIQNERSVIREERLASELLHTYLINQDEPDYMQDLRNSRLNITSQDGYILYCLSWEGRDGREQKVCMSGNSR